MPSLSRGRILDLQLREAERIVFLCSGNMVRSAFAELYARHLGLPLLLSSAATIYRNDRLFPETAEALLERGVPLSLIRSFRPTHLADLLPSIERSAVLFGMTHQHLRALSTRPSLRARGHLLTAVEGRDEEIADPVLEGADFEQTFERIASCVDALAQRWACG